MSDPDAESVYETVPVDVPHASPDENTAAALLADWSRWLFDPDQVVELRALKVRRGKSRPVTEAGYFDGDHRLDLARTAWQITPHAAGTYVTLNPLNPALIARRVNRVDYAAEGDLAKDGDVTFRRWLLLDADPVRPSGIGATDAEKAAAFAVIQTVRQALKEDGWPAPLVADSGNGYHLLYRIDLPADDGGLVKNVLLALADRFDTDDAKVDKSVHNPARIVKLPGTLSRKGDPTPDRPHRRSRLLEVPAVGDPSRMGVVTREQLEAWAQRVPEIKPKGTGKAKSAGTYDSKLDVRKWLDEAGVGYRVKDKVDKEGRTVYVLKVCPFNADHADPDAAVMQDDAGMMSAQCFHDGCASNGWAEFKAKIGAPKGHHYDPPLGKKKEKESDEGGDGDGAETKSDQKAPSGYRVNERPLETDGNPVPPAADAGNTVPSGTEPTRGLITIDESNAPVDATMRQIANLLRATRSYYLRADQLVRIANDTVTPVLQAKELIGAVNAIAEVTVVSDEGDGQFKPLPVNYANTWLCRPDLHTMLPVVTTYTRNPVYTLDWRLAPPGYDPASGIYSAAPPVSPRDGTARLDVLLKDFCFVTPGDRTNYLGFLLTILLMPRFIGSKPAALFLGNQPGLGKTMLAQVLAVVRDGRPTETVTYNPNDEEFEKRLGAAVRAGATTVIIDNAKARAGRDPRIDSACLERSITDEVLSYRLLGASDRIRAENSHLFCLTANTPELSRDLVTRSVAIRLRYEGDPAKRRFTIADPVAYAREHRVELLGELVGMVDRWLAAGRPEADVGTRFNAKGWGRIVGGILAHNGHDGFLANAETIAAEVDETRRDFGELVAIMADDPKGWWTPADLVERAVRERLFEADFKDRSLRSQVTRFGLIATRYDNETFPLAGTSTATFLKREERKGAVYLVSVGHPAPD
jgi:hypothetical protein